MLCVLLGVEILGLGHITDVSHEYKKLSYRRGTAQCVVSVEILLVATQQCRNYLYDKSCTKYQLSLIGLHDKIVLQTELDYLCDLQWSSVGARRYYKLS